MTLDRDALDRWITGGRYRGEAIRATCSTCGSSHAVISESEFGWFSWNPDECPTCGVEWDEDTQWDADEPPEPDPFAWRL